MIRSKVAAALSLIVLLLTAAACTTEQADSSNSGLQPLDKPMFNDINGGTTTEQLSSPAATPLQLEEPSTSISPQGLSSE